MSFQIQKFKNQFVAKTTAWFFVVTAIVVSDSLMAQNPLRAQTPEYDNPQSSLTAQQPRQAPVHSLPAARQLGSHRSVLDQNSQEQLAAHTQNVTRDVEQTMYRAPTSRDRQFGGQKPTSQIDPSAIADSVAESSAKMNFIQRDNLQSTQPAAKSDRPEQQNLGQLISKLGMNLAFVLFLAIGGVLAAKQWIKPGGAPMRKSSTAAKATNPSMQVIDTLRIDSKTTLHLIDCDDSRVLVATDAAGIKSVNLLTPSFDHALMNEAEAFENAEPNQSIRGNDPSEEGATPKPGLKHTSYAPPNRKPKPTPTIYQPPHEHATSKQPSKESSDGMDEKLIRMLLENSKKRHVAR